MSDGAFVSMSRTAVRRPSKASRLLSSPAGGICESLRLLMLNIFHRVSVVDRYWTSFDAEISAGLKYAACLAAHHGGFAPDLSNRDLSGLDLANVDFRSANLTGANLKRANLDRRGYYPALSDLSHLAGAQSDGAKLRDASAFSTIFAEADLTALISPEPDWSATSRTPIFNNANLEAPPWARTCAISRWG